MAKQKHGEWYLEAMRLKGQLEADPSNLELAQEFWNAIGGSTGWDVRTGNRVVNTFRACAFKSNEGLAAMLSAFRKLADDTGEFPRPGLLDLPIENLIRVIARQPDHPRYADACWILKFIDTND